MTFKEFFQKISSRIIWGNLLAMALTAIALVVGVLIYLGFYTHHGETISVPNVVGQRSEVAQRKLESLGLRVEITDTGHVTSCAADIILEQRIAPGTPVKTNRLIQLTVNSAKARTIPFPNIVDGSLREATMKLKAIGFKMGAVKRIDGDLDLVMRAEVLGREVHFGERISIESPITLVVGNGKTEDYYTGDDSLAWAMEREAELFEEE